MVQPVQSLAPIATDVPTGSRLGLTVRLGGPLVVAIAVAVGVLGATGQLIGGGPFDPGPVVRYGLPIVRSVHDLAAAVTVGLLVVGAWFIGPERKPATGRLAGGQRIAVRLGAVAATVWLASGLLVLVFTTADVSGVPISTPGFGQVFVSFVGQIDLGRELGVSLLLAAIAATLAATATRVATAAWASAVALIALLPLALAGHAAGSRDHMNAVSSLAFHLVAVCLWVGGLVALLSLSGRLGAQLPAAVARYSRMAGWCFGVVAVSGAVNAWLRLGSLAALATGYGLLVIGKTVALVLLGLAGWLHRTRTLPSLAERPRLFRRLVAVEFAVMGMTIGLAVALSRSAPPPASGEIDPVSNLVGFPIPPPLTVSRYLTEFYPDLLWLTVAVGVAAAYAIGLLRMRRRGDRWPWTRSVAWFAGCLLLIVVTSGGPGVYGRLSFSSHMLQHMLLMMVVPLLWVLGAPITLALRALNRRTDGSLGAREALLAAVHSRPLKLLGHPIVAEVLFFGSLVTFYYTPLFELAMFTHPGHVLMVAHFLGVGYLLIWCMVGIDPGTERPGYPFRMLMLLVMLGFHAFFGISLMASNSLLAPDWWHALGLTDDAALIADQQRGGGIAWGAGDIPSLLLGVALVVGWVRDDTRKARQTDRQADRDGDAALRAHNERLAALARHDERR